MKRKIYEAGAEIIKVFWIYVLLMAVAVTICIGISTPVLGVGALVIATFLNTMFNAKTHIGGGDDDSGRNED